MKEKTYTHKDLATLINVSETTIKSYRKKFPNCLPIVNTGKPIRFTAQALTVCERIRDLFHEGMAIMEVHTRLANEFSWVPPPDHTVSPPSVEKNNTADFSIPLNAIAQGVMSILQQQKEVLRKLKALEDTAHSVPSERCNPIENSTPPSTTYIPEFLMSYPLVIQNSEGDLLSIGEGFLPKFTLMDLIAILNYNFRHPEQYIARYIPTQRTSLIIFEQLEKECSQTFSIELLPQRQGMETVLLILTFLINDKTTPVETLISFIRS